ncbi:MAG: hydrogen gas-evolving membrane-bound hydrogenase subunit E [Acidimicrobiales bacterium]
MVWWLMGAHLVGVAAAGLAGRRSMRAGLLVAAIAPAVTTIWALALMIDGSQPTTHELVWVDGLGLTIRFRTDALALLMTLLVSGIGTLVFTYAVGYFSPGASGGSRFPPSLLAFSASMLGLVWADSIWTLFIFWEFTSITSFMLIGFKHTDESVRTAARRALMITGAGGLALLAGLILLENEGGTTGLTDLQPVTGATAGVAAALILVGAATKSAQFPFHVWLPGAMAAPTPVSAYLHSATMVKAGVLLVAVVGPAFADVTAWKVLGFGFGATSMVWGAIGALRHRDAKLILAWGTVSQLGLLITLFSLGEAKAVFAGVALVFSHAIFKAALFLVVGEIDVRTGTRDITELGGLARTMPIAFGVALVAGLSMAGAPPTLGFMAKEAAVEAVLGLSGLERAIAVGAVVGGAVLTVAYTVRFLIVVFGPGPATVVRPRRASMTVPAATLAAVTVLGYFMVGVVNDVVTPAATELNAKADVYSLIPWPGLTTAFVVSAAVLAVGGAFGYALARGDTPRVPAPIGAEQADRAIDGVLAFSPRITASLQHGSLPVYLATLGSAALIATVPFFTFDTFDHLYLWDDPIQAAMAATIVTSAVVGAFIGTRLGAALTLGAVGIGISGLFAVQGAPDLALTQLLVETVVVVGFVLGLGHLSREFPASNGTWRGVRLSIAAIGAIAVPVALAASAGAPTGQVPLPELVDGAVTDGGGKNLVNVVLTDLRALDTLGEVVVLATVAIGIVALARLRKAEVAS